MIVHAHPEPQSFCASMARNAQIRLRRAGHEVIVSDLYAMQFNPVASSADFHARRDPDYLVYALEQREGFAAASLSDDIRSEVERVSTSDLLILNFPIYWFSMPAMLKGWIDRVFLSGPFYGGKRFYDRGGMSGKRALVCATIGGRPHMFGPRAIHGEINDMLRPILRGTLAYVGYEVLQPYIAYHVPYLSDAERNEVMSDFERAIDAVENRPALAFPKIEDFDERLYPREPLKT